MPPSLPIQNMLLSPNTRFGRYEIRSKLGEGGMGEVYLAEDMRLGRKVALKILPAEATKTGDHQRRFEQEARAASRLSHPHIAHIYEIGEESGVRFIAMEYVEGKTLGEIIADGSLPIAEIVRTGAQIADALDEAHSLGVIHRDIKSQNVMINARGRVKVLDFGLAKISRTLEEAESTAETRVKTKPGVVMGTVQYMSPEQALGRETDARTDIWSLGVILYEVATGRLPFQAESLTETIDKIAHAQPEAIARFNYDVPPELEVIIKKALRKNRDERYQSARDILVDLENLKRELELTEHSVTPGPRSASHEIQASESAKTLTFKQSTNEAETIHTTTSSAEYVAGLIKRHKTGAIIVSAIVLFLIAGLGYGLYRLTQNRSEQTSQTNKPAPNLKIQRLTGDGKTTHAVISPDGKFLANVRNEGGQKSLWVKQISTNSNVQVVAPGMMENFYALAFTPDGSYVYFSGTNAENAVGTIFRVPVLGGSISKVIADGGHFSFSPDGKQLVFDRVNTETTEHALLIVNADGSNERKIAARSGQQWFRLPPAWSPDGKLIACGVADAQLPEHANTIVLIGVADGAVKEMTSPKWDYIDGLAWLPDMSGIIFEGSEMGGGDAPDQIWEISYPAGEARRLTHNLTDYSKVSLTADGKTLVTVERETNSSIWVSPNADLGAARQITTGKGDYTQGIAWTPDNRIVYFSTASGAEELWIMNADGSGAKQLTNDGRGKTTHPVVSPDGRYIVYGSANGSQELWRVDINGGSPVRLTNGSDNADPNISPDGKWLVYSSYMTGKVEIWRVPMEGGEAQRLTDFSADEPAISPDGKYIACFHNVPKSDRWRIGIIPFEGGALVKTFDAPLTLFVDKSPVWTPDGRGITYIDMRGGVGNLWLQPVDGGAPRALTDYKQNGIWRRTWTRDGKQVAIVRGEETSDAVMITGFR